MKLGIVACHIFDLNDTNPDTQTLRETPGNRHRYKYTYTNAHINDVRSNYVVSATEITMKMSFAVKVKPRPSLNKYDLLGNFRQGWSLQKNF